MTLLSESKALEEGVTAGPNAYATLNGIVLAAMRAEIATGKATKRSLGVLYGLLLGDRTTDWPTANGLVTEALGDDLKTLDRTKQIGWQIYDHIVANRISQQGGK